MSPEMARQLGSLSLVDGQSVPSARSLIAVIERNPAAKPPREIEALGSKLNGAQTLVVQEDQFWKEIQRFYYAAPNLFASTLQWLDEQPVL
jgi:hypothetical protein